MSNPARFAIFVAATNSAVTASISARVISRGTAFRLDHGRGDGAMISQFPEASGASPSSHPTWVEAFRPACPIWQQIFASVSAWTKSTIRVHAATVANPDSIAGAPGTIVALWPSGIDVACGRGVLRLTELQAAGRNRLPAELFLRGRPLAKGTVFDPPPAP